MARFDEIVSINVKCQQEYKAGNSFLRMRLFILEVGVLDRKVVLGTRILSSKVMSQEYFNDEVDTCINKRSINTFTNSSITLSIPLAIAISKGV